MTKLDDIFNELGFPTPPAAPPPVKNRESIPRPKGPCGKSIFASEDAVKAAIRSLLRGRKGNTSFLRPYPCEICHAWHMSSSKPHKH